MRFLQNNKVTIKKRKKTDKIGRLFSVNALISLDCLINNAGTDL